MKRLRIKILLLQMMLVSYTGLGAEMALNVNQRVLGVIVSDDPGKSLALIKNQESKKVSVYKLGQLLDKNIFITKIGRKLIEISVSGKPYVLAVGAEQAVSKDFDPSTTVSYNTGEIERNGNTVSLTAGFKDHVVKEKLGEILMQAATEIVMDKGRIIGFRIFDITPQSVYDKAGIQNGDIVTHINGLEINDAGVAIRALNQMKTATEANIRYLRAGSPQELKIQIQ